MNGFTNIAGGVLTHIAQPVDDRDVAAPDGAEYSNRLSALARFTLRHKALTVLLWIGLAAVLAIVFPQLETIVARQSVQLLPNEVPSFQAVDRMADAFDEQGAKTSILVAMEDPDGPDPPARQRYDALVAALRADPAHVLIVQDLLSNPATRGAVMSEDGKAWFLPVGIAGTLGDPTSSESIEAVRSHVTAAFDGSATSAHVTGPAVTFYDQIAEGEHDLLLISAATAALIALILLLIYRSLVTALLPLLVIGISMAVSRGVISALGTHGVPVSQFTIAFMTAVLLGAGTDYSVFLISRYHELRRRGVPPEDAIILACGNIGRVILASAATVALALASMVFARLSVFKGVGPACAVAVLIGFLATVTFLPPLLAVAARRGFAEPGAELTRRYWNWLAVAVVRQPGRWLAVSLVVLGALTAVATTMTISYDDRRGQPSDTGSNLGYRLLDRHFPKDSALSQFLIVQSPDDMRTARSLADLDEIASRIAQLPGVARISGVTRPTGKRLDQAELSWQTGQIGEKMADAVAQGQSHRADLDQLASGADQLADGLAQLDTALRGALSPLSAALAQAHEAGEQLQTARPLLDALTATAPAIDTAIHTGSGLRPLAERADNAIGVLGPLIDGLNGSPWCAITPQCGEARDQTRVMTALRAGGFFDQVARIGDQFSGDRSLSGTLDSITTASATMQNALGSLGDPADLTANFALLQQGVGRLAWGAQTLATGVRTLVDSNIELLGGMGQIATQLQNAARDTSGSDAASGFYLPPSAFDRREFNEIARQFISRDGRTARFAITSTYDPFSADAMALNNRIVDTAGAARPNTSLSNATIAVAGFPAINADLQRLLTGDFLRLAAATLVIVGLVLIALLRAVVAPLYLLATVVLNYSAAVGLGVLVFQHGFGHDIAWPIPLMAFILLVAVGADYNMLVISRLREESTRNVRVGVMRTVTSTGSVITSAGLIFAASMFGLMLGSVAVILQAGFVIGCGLLLDTFLVRTLTVPALAVLLREKNWWPRRSGR